MKSKSERRIQSAVTGVVIPLMLIPKLYRELATLEKGGASVEVMAAFAKEFVRSNHA